MATPVRPNIMAELLQDLTFLPGPEQRKVKSAFWTIQADSPMVPGSVSLDSALIITSDNRLRKWWTIPGFSDWFANKEEFRQRIEYLAHLALDTAEDILLDPKANANARVSMAKLVIEAANRMPQKYSKEIYLDEKIGTMGKRELEEYIKRATAFLPAPPPPEPSRD